MPAKVYNNFDDVLRGLASMMQARKQGVCPFCREPVDPNDPNSFRDELSKREYKISGLCQKCQDDFFGR